MKAGLIVLSIGLGLALMSASLWALSGGVLEEETLKLDPDRANIASSHGTAGYRIDLEHLEAGDRVLIRFEYRLNVSGSASVWPRDVVEGDSAPAPEGALASVSGTEGDLEFTAPAAGEYALVLESPEEAPKGAVRITWEPPVEVGRNPVFLGAARAVLTIGGGLGLLLIAASLIRRRRAGHSPR